MVAATNKVSQVEEEISVKQDRVHKLLWENHNKSSPGFNTAFSEAFTDLFLATWERNRNRSTTSFDDGIDSITIDSQVETDVEKLEYDSAATTKCSHITEESEMMMTENKIDLELKSIPLDLDALSSVRESIQNFSTMSASNEGNFQSIPLIEFSYVDGFSDVTEITQYKVTTIFLDYQEGKPFTSGNKFCNDGMYCEASRAKDYNSIKGVTRNYVNSLAIDDCNSYLIPKFSIVDASSDVSSIVNYTGMIIDKGRQFEDIVSELNLPLGVV